MCTKLWDTQKSKIFEPQRPETWHITSLCYIIHLHITFRLPILCTISINNYVYLSPLTVDNWADIGRSNFILKKDQIRRFIAWVKTYIDEKKSRQSHFSAAWRKHLEHLWSLKEYENKVLMSPHTWIVVVWLLIFKMVLLLYTTLISWHIFL